MNDSIVVSPIVSIADFHAEVLHFYYTLGRHHLSFRATTHPYHIHLSEIMLSQTQVTRVEEYFARWLERFPTPQSVMQASKTELLTYWQGLGYNSRVLNFQIACTTIIETYNGRYPTSEQELLTLKGVGPYVASAILAFAFNINVGVVDTNIRRILIYYGFATEQTSAKKLKKIAYQLTPKDKAREWNNALMDFGSLYLTAKKTNIASVGKQGKFEGSMRQVRSFIMKQCLAHGKCMISEIEALCTTHNHDAKAIINKLITENIIVQHHSYVILNDS